MWEIYCYPPHLLLQIPPHSHLLVACAIIPHRQAAGSKASSRDHHTKDLRVHGVGKRSVSREPGEDAGV